MVVSEVNPATRLPFGRGRYQPIPLSADVRVELAGRSHRGLVRPNNEDHFLTCRFGRHLEAIQSNMSSMAQSPRFEETGYGMAVADGMGGNAAGEIASELAINAILNLVLHTPDWILRLDDDLESQEVLRRATERCQQVGDILSRAADRDPSLRGFGTTLTIAWSLGETLFLSHVGDSRAYLLREGRLRRLTVDQTLPQQLADQGVIAREQVARHRLRNVLTQWLGDHDRAVEPELGRLHLQDGDRILLCTDGLTEMVAEAAIAEILGGDLSPDETCGQLLDRALEAGGKDNVTAIVARYRMPVPDADAEET